MDPMMMAALAGGLGGLGKGGGSTKVSQQTSVANTFGITTPNTNTFGLSLANNPTIANVFGQGSTVAPASGGASLPQSVAPYVDSRTSSSANPSQTSNDGSGTGGLGTSFLPRSSPTGILGTGSGLYAGTPAAQANDLLLILLICGVGLFLIMET